MKKHVKKIIAVFLAVIMIAGLSAVGLWQNRKAYAKEAQMYIEIPGSVKKEMEFSVTIKVDSNVALYSIDAYLSYDPERLEFIPGDGRVAGAEGLLELKDSFGEETKKASYELTFKALQTGETELSLSDIYLIDYDDMDYISVAASSKSFEIGINKKEERDASLSDLIVAPGELTKEFSPKITEYEMHVDSDVETIGISAIPADEDSVVALDMPEKLSVGKNEIHITVTAPSGNVKAYTIAVYRGMEKTE